MFARLATVSFGLPTEVDVSAPTVDDLDVLHRRIVATLAALRGARDAYDYSPNADTEYSVTVAERRLADLLDRLPRETT